MAKAEERGIVVAITALGPTLGATVVWRTRGQLYVTVVVKATFALVADADMSLTAPEPIVRRDVFPGGLPNQEATATSELAPYLARADVTFTGHAYAPGGRPVPTLPVRFAVLRDRPLLDKGLLVRGDQQGDGPPKPFKQIPVRYDRAFGGAGWSANPFGVGFENPAEHPNILPPTGQRATAGLGPIASVWPVRQKRLGATPRKVLAAPVVEIPDSFDWSYFQSAPDDQQVDFLAGDEWVLLQGLHPELPGIRSRLPDARGVARIHGLTPSSPELARQIDLRADMLIVSGDRQTCSMVWRSPVAVRDEAMLADLKILVGMTAQGRDAALEVEPTPRDPARGIPQETAEPSHSATMDLDADDVDAVAAQRTLPFTPGIPGNATLPSGERAQAPKDPSDFSGTVFQPEEEGRASPRAATPFERGSRPPEPRPSAPPLPPIKSAAAPAPEARATELAAPREAPKPADAKPAAPKPAAAKRPTTPEGIELWNDTGLSLGAVPGSGAPAGKCVVVIVKATCDLVPKGPAIVRSSAEPLERDRFYEGERGKSSAYPTDFATHKPRADVVLVGHAYAPGGSAHVMDVSFKFGRPEAAFARSLRVSGDRVWEKGKATMKPSEPAHFDRIPIRYDYTSSGRAYPANPVGLGAADPARLAGSAVKVPNLEDPDRLLRIPSQKVPPACFAPVLGAWRKRGGGEADDPWPPLEGDEAASRYQAAPLEQQLDSLQGNEPFELTGLHPRHPVIVGSLPGLLPRAFAERRAAPAETARFEEVKLTLDTVIFDVDAMAVHLVFRGAVPVADERAPEITALYLAADEPGARAMSIDEARSRFKRSR